MKHAGFKYNSPQFFEGPQFKKKKKTHGYEVSIVIFNHIFFAHWTIRRESPFNAKFVNKKQFHLFRIIIFMKTFFSRFGWLIRNDRRE